VNTDRDATRARRYLLRQASDDERLAIEREYFGAEDALDRMARAEDDLIEDYLSGRLPPEEHRQFERNYLASLQHRRRVETIRRLMTVASTSADRRQAHAVFHRSPFRQLAWAALVVLAVGAAWMVGRPFYGSRTTERPSSTASTATDTVPAPALPNQPSPSPPALPRVIALSISPVNVRSADESPSLVIPAGTDIVTLRLEGDAGGASLGRARASVATVSGQQVWEGATTSANDLATGVVARLDVPAARLHADDYIVVLFGTNANGLQEERYRYLLRVRAR
jgi:hypothetical protein